VLLHFLTIAGGVALILLGAGDLRRALDRLFGVRLESWIQGLAATRTRAFASGLGFSLLAPSSTTMAMLAIQSVDEHLASPAQILAMLLGAGIGLTATIQLVALRLSAEAPIFVLAGMLLTAARRSARVRQVGRMIIGMGFIFLGIAVVQQGLAQGIASPLLGPQALSAFRQHVLLPFAAALVLSLLTQSATATIALGVALADSQAIRLTTAVPWVVGANLGIALTVFLGGFLHREARRVGAALTLLQALVAVPLIVWAGDVASALERLPGSTAHAIANAHTLFNVAVAAIGLVFLTPLFALADRLVPAPRRAAPQRYLDSTLPLRPAESVSLATSQVRRELLRIGQLVADDLATAWRGVASGDGAALERVRGDRMAAARLFARVRAYLALLSSQDGRDADRPDEPTALARMLADLEVLHGAVASDLTRLGLRLLEGGIRFSPDGQRELDGFARDLEASFGAVLRALAERDRETGARLRASLLALADRAHALRDLHFERLRRGLPESLESSLIHLDVLTFLRLIAERLAGLAAIAENPAS
jgi:phosphate:Na+ symporter